MKILSVVTLVSPDGAYGGPLRVAVNQAVALQQRGHQVTLVAGHRGYSGPPPTELGGVPTRLFPARRLVPRTGFAGLAAPGMVDFLRRNVHSYDIVHLHVARDLVTLPAARLTQAKGVPYVLQTHGMIDASKNPLARLLDPALTLPVLRGARAVLYLTPIERQDLRELMGSESSLEHVINGVPPTDLVADPATPEVLYLARLAPRKRPQVMLEIANALVTEFPAHRYRLVGPDEGQAAQLKPAMASSPADVAWEGPLSQDDTLQRMSRSGVYVLPSLHEPYPMTVIEAMSVGLPVVITNQNGLAGIVERSGAGIVAGTSTTDLIEAVRTVLGNVDAARQMGAAGKLVSRGELGMDAIAEQLVSIYERSAG